MLVIPFSLASHLRNANSEIYLGFAGYPGEMVSVSYAAA